MLNWIGVISPGFPIVGYWIMPVAVPWNELCAVVEKGLWFKLSMAPTVTIHFQSCGGPYFYEISR